jgi:hypothetical protein
MYSNASYLAKVVTAGLLFSLTAVAMLLLSMPLAKAVPVSNAELQKLVERMDEVGLPSSEKLNDLYESLKANLPLKKRQPTNSLANPYAWLSKAAVLRLYLIERLEIERQIAAVTELDPSEQRFAVAQIQSYIDGIDMQRTSGLPIGKYGSEKDLVEAVVRLMFKVDHSCDEITAPLLAKPTVEYDTLDNYRIPRVFIESGYMVDYLADGYQPRALAENWPEYVLFDIDQKFFESKMYRSRFLR